MLPLLPVVLGLLPGSTLTTQVIGRSVEGRPIVAVERGAPWAAHRVLVVGCIHGPTECAGTAVVRALRRAPLPAGVAVWLVPNLNPDALRLGTRANADGVNLNRNFPVGWRPRAGG